MQVTETKNEGLSREFNVIVPAKEIETRISDRLKEIAKTIKMPGFRPGKVPPSLLRKRYGDSLRGEILEQTVNETSNKTINDRELRPASQPKIEITTFDEGGDLEYTIALDIIPEIVPCDFSKIKLERLVVKIEDKEIDETIDRLASMHKSSEPVTAKRKSKSGDITVIDFIGKVDDVEFPGGTGEAFELELGSNSFIPGFEDQLIGAKAGDHVDVKVTFPEEYGAEDLAGKDAVFSVDVKELREAIPSPIDDELAKKFSKESLSELKDAVREDRQREFAEISRMRLKRVLLDELFDAHDFETPQSMIDDEFNSIWKQYEHSRDEGTLDDDDKNKSEEDHKEDFMEISKRRVRLGLLLSEVGRTNNIQVSQDEINQRMFAEAQKYQGQEQQVLEFYKNNPESMQSLSAPLYEDKVVDFILELAKISEKSVSLDELMVDPEEKSTKKPTKKKAKKADSADKKEKTTSDKKKAAPKKKPAAKKKAADK